MSNSSFSNLTLVNLRRAVSIKEQIDGLQGELNQILGGSASASMVSTAFVAGTTDGRRGRKRSPEMRARMAAAQRARWAKKKKSVAASVKAAAPVAKPAAPAAKKRKRSFSPEALARISSAAKARWVKAKASGKKRLG